MDQQALESSSEAIRSALNYIEDTSEDELKSDIAAPIIFYLYDKYNDDRVDSWVRSWPDESIDIGSIVFEAPTVATLYAKLISDRGLLLDDETILQIKSRYESLQMKNGGFQITTLSHVGPLWFLSHIDPNLDSVKDGIDYYLNEIVPNDDYDRSRKLALGAITLSDIDYFRHKSELESIGQELLELSQENEEKDSLYNLYTGLSDQPWLVLTALQRCSGDYEQFSNEVARQIIQNQNKDGSFFDSNNPISTAEYALALIVSGHGPKISRAEAQWVQKKQSQKIKRAKPEFVRTIPIDPSASYAAEIQESAEELISQAQDVLRVNSLYIDMLFDDIIDRTKVVPDLEVRVLTRGREVKGNRKRIKKDVLDDLVAATDGNVREYHRVHSRIVIADQKGMVVSSADLTRDQLRDQFNAGIYTEDSETVNKGIEYFETAWKKSTRVS